MARRNIFDRDTRTGDYSDALGNFLENIPSIYGQIAKEKRLENQRIDDNNYRIQTYNNQLLQQSRNNRRQKELDDLNERKFNQKVNNDNYTQAYQIAKAYYDATGDYSRLAQVEQQYSPETYDSEKVNKIKAGTTDRETFDANYLDWDSLSLDEKYSRGNELQDLISESSKLMKTGDPRNKINYQNINKILRDEFKTYTKNSGQLIKDKDLWSGQKGQIGLQAYNSNERGIKSIEKQITDLQTEVNKIIPIDKSGKLRDIDALKKKTLNDRIENLKNEKLKLTSGNVAIANDFRYPIFNIDPTGEDYALEGMKSERPVEQETNITDSNQERLEKIDADILASVGDLDDAKIDEFMSALESDNPEDLNNYLFGFEEGGDDLAEGEPAPKPIQTDLASVETGDDLPEGEPIPLTGDTVLPTATASPVQEFIENIEKESELPKISGLGKTPDEVKQDLEIEKQKADEYNIEPFTGAKRTDDKVIAQEKRKVSNYMTRDLEGDLIKLNRLKIKIKDFIGKDDQTSKFNLRKDSKTIKEIEDRIKNTIGEYINPISGDIVIGDEGYKKSLIQRLDKKIGEDLYPTLASLSTVQRIN